MDETKHDGASTKEPLVKVNLTEETVDQGNSVISDEPAQVRVFLVGDCSGA